MAARQRTGTRWSPRHAHAGLQRRGETVGRQAPGCPQARCGLPRRAPADPRRRPRFSIGRATPDDPRRGLSAGIESPDLYDLIALRSGCQCPSIAGVHRVGLARDEPSAEKLLDVQFRVTDPLPSSARSTRDDGRGWSSVRCPFVVDRISSRRCADRTG